MSQVTTGETADSPTGESAHKKCVNNDKKNVCVCVCAADSRQSPTPTSFHVVATFQECACLKQQIPHVPIY